MKEYAESIFDILYLLLAIIRIMFCFFKKNNFDFNFDGHKLKLKFNDKVVYEDYMKNPMIFKIVYDDEKIIDIDSIEL